MLNLNDLVYDKFYKAIYRIVEIKGTIDPAYDLSLIEKTNTPWTAPVRTNNVKSFDLIKINNMELFKLIYYF